MLIINCWQEVKTFEPLVTHKVTWIKRYLIRDFYIGSWMVCIILCHQFVNAVILVMCRKPTCCNLYNYTMYTRNVRRYQREIIRSRKSKKDRQRNGQKEKQLSTKHYKQKQTKDRATRIKLKTVGELRCSGRVSSSCSTCGTLHVIRVTNPVISYEWGKDRIVITINGTYINRFNDIRNASLRSNFLYIFQITQLSGRKRGE